MLDLRLFLNRRSRRENTQAVVNLHRIRVDDNTTRALCRIERKGGLAAGGWTCNEQRVKSAGLCQPIQKRRVCHGLHCRPHIQPAAPRRR